MGNCFNQEPTQNSSLKSLKKVDSFLSMQDTGKISLKDFVSLGEIGRGQFGKVLRVRMTCNDREYAMKVIKKADIMKFGLVEHTILEKNVLGQSKNPFVIKLKYSFQTDNKLYLVMELVIGGQFLKVIHKQPDHRLSNEQTVFCAAQVVLGLEYMHEELRVIYRDLKPENILVTEDGNLKLTDFGLSKKYEKPDTKFFTFAGTPEYLAPEILTDQGHDRNVDWWCLGILLYECLTGKTPFHDKQNNFSKIEQNIKSGKFSFPDYINCNARDLITRLLDNDPKQRLGYNGPAEIKQHAFFEGVNWVMIYNLEIESPIKVTRKPDTHLQTKRIFETPCSHINQTNGEFNGFSVEGNEILEQ